MKYLLFALFCAISIAQYAQNHTANKWYFGHYAGVDFDSSPPVALTNGALNTGEGCATICDENGDLMFYTDGQTIWNSNHQTMLNGTGLMGHASATQSGIIVPYPGTANQNLFFIFTIDARENGLVNGLRYSIVDMTLDGGLGGVNSTKNVLLHAPMSEKLTAVRHANQNDYWVIGHEWGTNAFYVYKITDTGISATPVITNIGSVHLGGNPSQIYSVGCIKANINGSKLAVANYRSSGYFELFNFSNATGILSNCKTSATTYYRPYGVEFSPDGTKLYGSMDGQEYCCGKIYQFDLAQSDPFNQPVLVASSSEEQLSTLQLGPDGKIYIAPYYYLALKTYLSVIKYPNLSGSSCEYTANYIDLNGREATRGLPTQFYYKGFMFSDDLIEAAHSNNDFNVFPNPASGYFSILNERKQANLNIYKLEIFDVLGNLVSIFDGGRPAYNISNLQNGVYLLKIKSDSNICTIKLIKN